MGFAGDTLRALKRSLPITQELFADSSACAAASAPLPPGLRYQPELISAEEEPLPAFLQPLRSKAGAFAACDPQQFAQALITEYASGAPIGWHRDKPEFGIVVGVSLLTACVLRGERSGLCVPGRQIGIQPNVAARISWSRAPP